MTYSCCLVPRDVLARLSSDPSLSATSRKAFLDTIQISHEMRDLRVQATRMTSVAFAHATALTALALAPSVTIYDCKGTQSLPGTPVPNPGKAADPAAKRVFGTTSEVAEFFAKVFGRNSIDGEGMTLMSSVHFGQRYNNAMWNGLQMIYGDGDGQIFVDFTAGTDVIAHELTHGVTQHSLQLDYSDEPGGLNESMSDCFGSMFRQWKLKQDVTQADWLIGADILGPAAKAKGFTCLRDMADPAGRHCLSPQPTLYAQVRPGMDPHAASGPPNLAFCTAAKTLGGKSWDQVGQIWYAALTGWGARPKTGMKDFAARTRQLAQTMYPGAPPVAAAVDAGWRKVGL
ncbi:MAG: M4 family metallopeptidase [Methylobacteriaceae bacterium]|nr:M4 family metallopeptidase [Methylobacteriaceae bacterium]